MECERDQTISGPGGANPLGPLVTLKNTRKEG
jgi:hypothetical protein